MPTWSRTSIPTIDLRDEVLHVRATQKADLDCRRSGVLLVPAVFSDGCLDKLINQPWQPTLYYPARATGMLLTGPDPATAAVWRDSWTPAR